jgi:hypothetical protein
MRLCAVAVACACAACHSAAPEQTIVYRIGGMTLPRNGGQFAGDVNGDGARENVLGGIVSAFVSLGWDLQGQVDAAFASGREQLRIELRTRADTSAASATVLDGGGGVPGVFAGRVVGGAFESPFVGDRGAPVELTLTLPFLDDARVPVTGALLSVPGVGAPALSAQLDGAIRAADVDRVIAPAMAVELTRLIVANGTNAAAVRQYLDTGGNDDGSPCTTTRACGSKPAGRAACTNPPGDARAGLCADACDDVIDTCEVTHNALYPALFAPDVALFTADGRWAPSSAPDPDALSLGVLLHATLAN